MALFVIEAVKFNDAGNRVESVRWGKVRGGEVSQPSLDHIEIADVAQVIQVLQAGDEVQTLFADESGVSFGPNVEIVQDQTGVDTIGTAAYEIPNRSLADLPKF